MTKRLFLGVLAIALARALVCSTRASLAALFSSATAVGAPNVPSEPTSLTTTGPITTDKPVVSQN